MDRFEEMAVFVAAAEEGGLAAASRKLGVSPPTVTRALASIEERIGAELMVRTTRSVTLTDVGRRYLADCRRILSALAEAEEHAAGEHAAPRGKLVVTAPVLYGQMFVAPVVSEFCRQNPAVAVDLRLADRVLSLSDEQIDVALRIAELPDSSMVAHRVGAVRRVVCGSPGILRTEGIPLHPKDLHRHRIVAAANVTRHAEWRFAENGEQIAIKIDPVLSVTSNYAAIRAAESGFGLTRVLSYQIARELAAGQLKIVLAEYELPEIPVHVVYPQGRQASAKVKTFVEFLTAFLRSNPALN